MDVIHKEILHVPFRVVGFIILEESDDLATFTDVTTQGQLHVAILVALIMLL